MPEPEQDEIAEQETVDLRQIWADFARGQGGSFVETERRGLERITPATVWRPVIQIPVGDRTLKLEARRQAMLGSWRKQQTSLRDWVAPEGDARNPLFDFTTILTLRYRSADGFRFALGPGSEESLTKMRNNVEIGPPVELSGLSGVSVHATDKLVAESVFRPRVADLVRPLIASPAPFELATSAVRSWWSIGGSRRFELRLTLGMLLVDPELLTARSELMREVFDGLRRAGSVEEAAGPRFIG